MAVQRVEDRRGALTNRNAHSVIGCRNVQRHAGESGDKGAHGNGMSLSEAHNFHVACKGEYRIWCRRERASHFVFSRPMATPVPGSCTALVAETEAWVRAKLSAYDASHDFQHVDRVRNMALTLARKEVRGCGARARSPLHR